MAAELWPPPFPPPDLAGRVAIVTGASRGVGRAMALGLARSGADVVVAAKSTKSSAKLPGSIFETASEVEALGRRALAVRCDVRDDDALAALVERTIAELGRIDVVVHNAGALFWQPVVDTPPKRFDLVVGVNARAAFVLTHLALPHMIRQGWGHVVTLSPPIDPAMAPGKVAYTISKLGMTLLALGLAEEVRAHGVAANALWPATAVESQATINHALGGPENWRRAEVLVDSLLAILRHEPPTLSGRALIDEEILAEVGVTDLARYDLVPGGKLLRIVGAEARNLIVKRGRS